jgi:hypothetical protein
VFLRCGGSLNVCDLVFIVVHDEEKSDVSISRLYLDGTGSCCLASTIVITDIRIAACEILPVRKKEPPLDGERRALSQTRRGTEVSLVRLVTLCPLCYFQR